MSTGLYIGRFQPFHLGHLSAIKQALEQVDHLIIGIGSSQYHDTPENPFTAQERQNMVKLALNEASLEKKCNVFLIPDLHDENRWVDHVKKIVPAFDRVFVGNDGLVKTLFEKDGMPVTLLNKEIDISATQVREAVKNEDEWQKSLPATTTLYLESIEAAKRLKTLSDQKF